MDHSGLITFTSGATPANLLITTLQLRLFGQLTFSGIGGTRTHATVCGTLYYKRTLYYMPTRHKIIVTRVYFQSTTNVCCFVVAQLKYQ